MRQNVGSSLIRRIEEMKNCFMITFGSEIFDDYVFTDYEQARQRLQQLKDEQLEDAKKFSDKSYDHWYELRVFKLVGGPDVNNN